MLESAEIKLTPEKLNVIAPGLPAYDSAVIMYKRNGQPALNVQLSNPVIITMASQPQEWGHYQFPTIFKGIDGGLVAKTHLSPDAVASYGKTNYIYSYSADKGKSWTSKTSSSGAEEDKVAEGLLLPSGDRIKIVTPSSINEDTLSLPDPVAATANVRFYRLNELPESRQGVFLARMRKGELNWVSEKAVLMDTNALRYSIKGEIPVVWWGDMKIASDKSIIACIYPGYYIKEDDTPDTKSGVFFYRSTDEGRTWKIQGRIPFEYDRDVQPNGEHFGGFTEPAFEILKDGTFLCIMRTTDNEDGPMYASRSMDMGVTWSKPVAIAPAGVLPRLLQLENGVLVLSSGRPGVQLRFSLDGKGNVWTKPFEMLDYDLIGKIDWYTSCGYTWMLATGPDEFLLIYSDFFTMNDRGQMRKSIKLRKISAAPF